MITERYKKLQDECQDSKLAKGTLPSVRDDVLKELGLTMSDFPGGKAIKYCTIKSRIQRGTTSTKKGPSSPAEVIEPAILQFIQWRLEAGQPMKPCEIKEFAKNSLIQDTEVAKQIAEFHDSRPYEEPTFLLGNGWYKGFVARHQHLLSNTKGVRQHKTRKDWCTHANMKKMYKLVYEQMIEAKIAERLPEDQQYWVDKDGNVVDSEDKAAGHKCEVKLTHPEFLLFADEVGTDTAQDKDKNVGGTVYVTIDGQRASLPSSKASSRFTVLGVTAATGEPLMCIVIMAAKEVVPREAMGFDHLAENPYDPDKPLKENEGPGKALPGLPTCEFRGKQVPGFLAFSPSGSVTSEILKEAAERLDKLGVFGERTPDGPRPMFLLAGSHACTEG